MDLPKGSTLFSTNDFTFINSKNKMINIRTYSLEDGDSKDKFIAHPNGALGFTGNKKFRTTGKSQKEALYNCLNLLNDIEDISIIHSKEDQPEIDYP